MIDRERLRDEVQRVHERYATDVVEALGLCPWARPAREAGRTRVFVSWDNTPELSGALAHMDAMEADGGIDVGFLAYPLCGLARLEFSHFVSELRAADAARKPLGQTVLAMADFHPLAAADLSSPERLVPLLRSSPDPTIQLVRVAALADVRLSENSGTSFVDLSKLSLDGMLEAQSTPPLSQRVARNNLKGVERMGVTQLRALLDDVLRDRDAAYAALGVTHVAWSAHGVHE